MKAQKYDRDTLEYIHNEITKLEIANWNKFHNETDFAKGMDIGIRDCARIITSILNDEWLIKSVE